MRERGRERGRGKRKGRGREMGREVERKIEYEDEEEEESEGEKEELGGGGVSEGKGKDLNLVINSGYMDTNKNEVDQLL